MIPAIAPLLIEPLDSADAALVGLGEGREVGRAVGREVGREVGRAVGWEVGREVGWEVGLRIKIEEDTNHK